jgi:hypothetical protein
MNDDLKVIDSEIYRNEIASLKRVSAKLDELRKWLLNTSLAGLAFAFTVFFQVKAEEGIPFQNLAALTVALFMLATALGFLCRGRAEIEEFVSDTRGIFKLLPLIRDAAESEESIDAASKDKIARKLDNLISLSDSDKTITTEGSQFTELLLIASVFLSLSSALVCLCIYIWRYLFAL